MNRFIVIFVAILVTSGCTGIVGTQQSPQGTRPVIFLQSGVQLQVFNLCSNTPGRIYTSTGEQYSVPFGAPTFVPIAPQPFMNTRELSATYFVYEGNALMGSVSRSFRIDRNRGTQTVQWIIGEGRRSGGQGVVVDRCPRS